MDLSLEQLQDLNIERASQAAKTCVAANGFMVLVGGLTQDKKLFVFDFNGQGKDYLLKMLHDYIEAVERGRFEFGDRLG